MTQNIFPLLSKGLWSRINSCYCIRFSNQKQKKNTTLLLEELLAVTWVPWILRHHVFSNLKQKKEDIIISNRVISSHMGLMYIETPYITMYSEIPYITMYTETPNIYSTSVVSTGSINHFCDVDINSSYLDLSNRKWHNVNF